jgi:acetyl-CoA carboxylase carboxyl transferase subunit alpha
MTAQDLLALGVIDRIVPEPIGGAHRDPHNTALDLGAAIAHELDGLAKKSPAAIRKMREDRYLNMGTN